MPLSQDIIRPPFLRPSRPPINFRMPTIQTHNPNTVSKSMQQYSTRFNELTSKFSSVLHLPVISPSFQIYKNLFLNLQEFVNIANLNRLGERHFIETFQSSERQLIEASRHFEHQLLIYHRQSANEKKRRVGCCQK